MPQQLVAFDAGHLNTRGTDVALFDYAHFNETLLGNRSVILCPARADLAALDRFRQRFSVLLYRDAADLATLLGDVDVYYHIAEGSRPKTPLLRPRNGRVVVHCVFRADQPHGDIYASVSDWVSTHYGPPAGTVPVPVVPHIVRLPDLDDDLRDTLRIPRTATVFGRHGGFDTFDLEFAQEAVRRIAHERTDAWFVFLGTRPFCDHERVVFLPATTDPAEKTVFINTCDAILHARAEGETFGLAVAEFSIRNKPVITWLEGKDNYHVEVLGRKGIYYRTPADLDRILSVFRPIQGELDVYSVRFSPEAVMARFQAVFLEPADRSLPSRPPLALDQAGSYPYASAKSPAPMRRAK